MKSRKSFWGSTALLSLSLAFAACSVEAEDPANEVLPTGSAENGEAIYVANCLSCHAEDLTGGEGGTDASNLTTLTGDVETTIKFAVRLGKTNMSAFTQSTISSQQLSDLIEYITTY